MRYIFCLFVATPAFAHDGAHLHPHGFESLVLLSLPALAGLILWVRR